MIQRRTSWGSQFKSSRNSRIPRVESIKVVVELLSSQVLNGEVIDALEATTPILDRITVSQWYLVMLIFINP